MQGQMSRKEFFTIHTRIENELQKKKAGRQNKDQANFGQYSRLPTQPSRSPEEIAERERTMKEAIEIANRKFGAPSNEFIKKKKKDPEREALQKLFFPFTFLETDAMKSIKERIDIYANEITEKKTGLDALRFQNRKDLFKIICIAVAELKSKKPEVESPMESFLLSNQDYYGYAATLVNMLEIHLFNKLFIQNVKAREEPYQLKIKVLRSQLNDKTNFRLRRGVINKTFTFEYLEKATEEDLKSNERKLQQKQLMERLVRESQAWEEVGYQKQIKYDDTQVPSEVEERKVVEAENIVLSDDEETAEEKAYKEATKNAYEAYQKCKLEMKQKIESLGDKGGKLLKNWQMTFQRSDF